MNHTVRNAALSFSLTPRFSEVGRAGGDYSTVSTVYSLTAFVIRLAFLCLILCPSLTGATPLSIIPSSITLHGPESRQQLILERTHDNQFIGQITDNIHFVSSDTNVVQMERNEAIPVKNGVATVTARSGKETASLQIKVEAMDKPFDWGDLIQPLTGKPQAPTPLDGKPLPIDAPEDRRTALADWLVSRDNPYFSRAIVNRVWANFMSIGLVEAVDDMRVTNPASNEKLLSALAKYLADQRFDLKALMRLIMQSETYQRSSQSTAQNSADTRFYSHHYPRRLMAEVMHDAIVQITGVPTQFQVDRRNAKAGLGEKYPLGFRAIQLPDTQTYSYFLKAFGRPDREKTCECERTLEPSVTQVLHIANGDTINKKLEAKNCRISKLIEDKTTDDKIVEDLYLSALSRYPTLKEKQKMLKTISGSAGRAATGDSEAETPDSDRRAVIEDIYWAVLSSREFLFNH